MASYSAVNNSDTQHPGPQHSTPVHLSALNPVESGGMNCSGEDVGATSTILVTLQKRWKCVAIVNIVLVVVVMIGLVVGLTTTQQCTNAMPLTIKEQQQRNADLTQLPNSEQHDLQQQEVSVFPRCGLVQESIKVIDILGINPSDEVLQGTLMTHNIVVTRCQGLCVGNNRCLSTHTLKNSFVVKYKDNDGVIQYTKREVDSHQKCQCQEA